MRLAEQRCLPQDLQQQGKCLRCCHLIDIAEKTRQHRLGLIDESCLWCAVRGRLLDEALAGNNDLFRGQRALQCRESET